MWRAIAAAAVGLAAAGARPPLGDVGVLMVDTATGAKARIASKPGAATWSRDGRRLFISGDVRIANPPTQSFETRDDSGRLLAHRVLRTANVAEGDVALSPDRRRIAYELPDPAFVNTGVLVVAPRGGGRATRLLTRAAGTPAWSPDGRRLVVERLSPSEARGDLDPHAVTRVVVVNVAGRRAREVATGRRPRWLPDGRLLVLQGSRLVSLDRAGHHRRVLIKGVSGSADWDVARDGRIAVTGGGVRVGDGDPGRAVRITSAPIGEVRWSPDGASLAAVADGQRVLLLDPAGEAPPRRLLASFSGRVLDRVAWSPDGRHLALASRVRRPED